VVVIPTGVEVEIQASWSFASKLQPGTKSGSGVTDELTENEYWRERKVAMLEVTQSYRE
jgi:hypothetical protein